MNNNDSNRHIGCTVTDCKYHSSNAQFCSLDKIEVIDNTKPATDKESTDCGSFEPKNM